jgi:glycosyltransferase involved in cell wall biosynthesis
VTPVRVLQVMPAATGGIARHVAQIMEGLDGRDGITVELAAPALEVDRPTPTHRVDIPEGPGSQRQAIAQIRALLSGEGYDVVHAHGLRAGIDAGLAARRIGTPVVVTVHNVILAETMGFLRAILYRRSEALAVRLATRVIAVSEEIAHRLPAESGKVEVLYAGIGEVPAVTRPREVVRAELDAADERLIVTAARLAPQKALHVMLEAVAELDDEILAIAGSGPLESELKALAGELGIAARVRWLGHRTDVPDLIAAADVFCLSSVWEAVAIVVQEAVLLGTPVVSTAVGGIPELITDEVSGRLVPPNDPPSLTSALRDVLDSPARGAELVKNAREAYDARFSSTKLLDRLTELYKELAGG